MSKKSNVHQMYLYGEIDTDYEINTKRVRQELQYIEETGAPDTLIVRLLSFGGLIHEAEGIINAFTEYKGRTGSKVVVINDSRVASAATNIMAASGDVSLALPLSKTLIHNAISPMIGVYNAEELRERADLLESATEPSIDMYVKKTGRSKEEVVEQMAKGDLGDESSWLSAEEAVDFGLVDGVYEGRLNAELAEEVMNNIEKRLTNQDGEYQAVIDSVRQQIKHEKFLSEIEMKVGAIKEWQKL